MKKIAFSLMIISGFVLGSCSDNTEATQLSPDLVQNPATASSNSEKSELAEMTFEVSEQNFGSIVQGESVKKNFQFTNTGNIDLIISSANGSCGCTIPKWPKRPISPGQTGVIEVVFNSQGKKGKQTKP
ncbi:MAG: DUF1573 domain-containing protein [Salibacteraceae bacterium]